MPRGPYYDTVSDSDEKYSEPQLGYESPELETEAEEEEGGYSDTYTTVLPGLNEDKGSDPEPTSDPAPAADTSGPTDEEMDAVMAKYGGRLTSRGMRELELMVKARNAGPSPTELKREAIMSKIPKTKTKDSEGGDLSFAGKDNAGLAGKKLVSKYEGEENSVAWRAFEDTAAQRWNMDPASDEFKEKLARVKASTAVKTKYDTTPEERERSLLKEKGDGKVKMTHKGNPDRDESGWVMDPESKNIHTFDPTRTKQRDGTKHTTHHSSPLGGKAVAGAGMMTVKNKHITNVSDESGHYRPEGEYTHQAVKEMGSRGLLDRKADKDEVKQHGAGEGNLSAKVSLAGYAENDPRQQKGWLKDEKDIFQGQLDLPYQAFLQTHGNERQARAKHAMLSELKGKVPEAPALEGDSEERYVSVPGYSTVGDLDSFDDDLDSFEDDSDDSDDEEFVMPATNYPGGSGGADSDAPFENVYSELPPGILDDDFSDDEDDAPFENVYSPLGGDDDQKYAEFDPTFYNDDFSDDEDSDGGQYEGDDALTGTYATDEEIKALGILG